MNAIVLVPNVPTRYDHLLQQRVPSIDVGKAANFGEIKLLSPYDPAGGVGNIEAAIDDVCIAIQKLPGNIQPTIVMAGDPVLISVAVAKALRYFDKINVLRWNRNDNDYEQLEIQL